MAPSAIPVLLLLAALAGGPAAEAPDSFTFRGRLRVTNGTPCFRIWRLGTKRILGVHASEAPDALPENIRAEAKFGTEIDADFEVRPVTPARPGHMQMVRVLSARHVVVRRLPQD